MFRSLYFYKHEQSESDKFESAEQSTVAISVYSIFKYY